MTNKINFLNFSFFNKGGSNIKQKHDLLYNSLFYKNNILVIKKKELSIFNLDLIEERENIQSFEMEPFFFNIYFENIFDINLFHFILHNKYSIIFVREKEKRNETLQIWNNYIDFLNYNDIIEKYCKNIITTKDCINYLNYVKNNMVYNLEYEKIFSSSGGTNEKEEMTAVSDICGNCKNENSFLEINEDVVCGMCGIVVEKIFIKEKKRENNNLHQEQEQEEDDKNFEKIMKKIEEKEESDDDEDDENNIKNTELFGFVKNLDYIEGKQKIKPPEQIIKKLEAYFDEHSTEFLKGKTCKYIREELLTNEEKRAFFNIFSIEKIFKKFKEKRYNKDIEYIANRIFGWKLIDLKDRKEKLIENYIAVQKKLKNRNIKVNLNKNIQLLFHLAIEGIILNKQDIKLIKSKESIDYHISILKGVATEMNLNINDFLNYFN